MALNIFGFVRATEDLDIFVAPDRENVGLLKAALKDVFQDPNVEEISADDLLGDYPAVQYIPPSGDFHVDILTRLGEMFRFEDLEIERAVLGGFEVSVVSPRMLYRMKRDTVRAKDRLDAQLLREKFDLEGD
ncbi:MAG: hypothetical protein L6R30_20605 [Thermoanaerobaculia bacterium]|nr:hypothetical protein [Thermoanaerobaculia bacterium]